jgi:tetratricopeptide (TPR) repeat protein
MLTKTHTFPIFFILVVLLIAISQPVLAAYQQPYYSPAYKELSPQNKTVFSDAMKQGDALYKAGQYNQAAEAYRKAVSLCPNDYTAEAAYGQALIAQASKTSGSMKQDLLDNASKYLYNAEQHIYHFAYQQGSSFAGYEEFDLMAKIQTSWAELFRLEGNETAAQLSEREAAEYRQKANESVGGSAVPLSPLLPFAGLGVSTVYLYLKRRGYR